MRYIRILLITSFFLWSSHVTCDEEEYDLSVHLEEPTLADGVLTTEKGGVVYDDEIRIQARHIQYTRVDGTEAVSAREDLILNHNGQTLVGKSLKYDFISNSGSVQEGRISFDGWFVGGEEIDIHSDNSYTIHQGYITNCPGLYSPWKLHAEKITISADKELKAERVHAKVNNASIFVIPSLSTNLETRKRVPFSVDFHWGGFRGARMGVRYHLLEMRNFDALAYLNYHFSKGLGGGIDTTCKSDDGRIRFLTKNYLANDISTIRHVKHLRYRFFGKYTQSLKDEKTSILAQYDRLKDEYMVDDMYLKSDFDLKQTHKTQLLINHQEHFWKLLFLTDVRINPYETMNQHLPSLEATIHPFAIGSSGVILDNRIKLEYLDFVYSKYGKTPPDFNSTRLAIQNETYRPFNLGNFVLTPSVELKGIYYGNSMQSKSIALGSVKAGADLKTQLHKIYGNKKHTVIPYASYRHSFVTKSPNTHYLFSMEDGFADLSALRLGVRNNLSKKEDNTIRQIILSDIYMYSFHKSKNFSKIISKIGGSCQWFLTPKLLFGGDVIWNYEQSRIDRINVRADYTVSKDLALGVEYRHRGPYDWRKSDRDNFTMDSFRSNANLRNSRVSDRRDTIIGRIFYRITPDWSCRIESRNGWNRKNEPFYREFRIDFMKKFYGKWNLRFSFQHTEEEDAVSFSGIFDKDFKREK